MKKDQVYIQVKSASGDKKEIRTDAGANLLEVLRANGSRIPAGCGGKGTCGKCKVRIEGKETLACLTEIKSDMAVEVLIQEDDFSIEVGYHTDQSAQAITGADIRQPCIAVDIGTTTVALQLLDASTGAIVRTSSFLNAQRQYGADVISRIQLSNEGGVDTLQAAIRDDLNKAISALCTESGIEVQQLAYICIAGNTTMMYLLLGLSCQSLGKYPFHPEFPVKEQYPSSEVLGDGTLTCPIYLLPWASAYVGGDITAGYLACCNGPKETALLIDMGTNGEMMLWSGEKIWCTSTAAGPAFEGGGITFGTGSIPGAISRVDILDNHQIVYETIGGAPAVGICGSGVLDIAAGVLLSGYIDDTGRMEDKYGKQGVEIAQGKNGQGIYFTQKDIRELQLAKSAIRAGVEILLQESGIAIEQLDTVYLAGGFGQKLRLESAVAIGLIPQSIADKAKPSGNSSLGGCVRACANLEQLKIAHKVAQTAEEVLLSTHKDFQNQFMEHMAFE